MSAQLYTPYICNITAVTKGQKLTQLTTDVPYGFVIGNQVSFQVPKQYGMRQLDGQKAYVLTTDNATQFTVVLDSSQFDPFVVPSITPPTVIDPAQVMSVGDANSGYSAPGAVQPMYQTIPGAFQAQFLT